MNKISRRSLARYGAEQITAGTKPAKLARCLAGVLIADGRVGSVELLVDDILYEMEISGRHSVAKLTTARELTKALETQIASVVKTSVGVDSVEVESDVDTSLIGGFRLQTATKSWDTSIKTKLIQLKEAF